MPDTGFDNHVAVALVATSLPFLVTATMVGTELGVVSPANAAALVGAGIASVLLVPLVALGLLRRRAHPSAPAQPPPSPPSRRPARHADGRHAPAQVLTS